MNIKALFFDVDGTLLSFDTHRVSVSTIEAITKLREAGIKVIIATGRAYTDLNELKGIYYDAVVALNGAECVLRDGSPIACKPIKLDDFLKLKVLANEYGFPLAVETDQGFCIDKVNQTVIDLAKLVDHPVPTVVDIENAFRAKECCQLCIYCDETREEEVMRKLPGLTVSRWNPLFADVNVAGVDKSVGIDEMCNYYGFDRSEVMAFGDGGNDIPMLRAAGIGVAMGSASEKVKDSADYVTGSVDEDGVVEALLHFGLIR